MRRNAPGQIEILKNHSMKRRLRVVRVSERVTPSPGGREVHVRELCRSQARHGHSVRLLYRVGGELDWLFPAKALLDTRRIWQRLPHSVASSLFLAAAIIKIARNRRATDLAHFHGDYLEAVAAGAVRLFGIPSLLTLHARLSPRVLHKIGFVYRLPSHVVGVSPTIIAQLEHVGVPRSKMTVQPSGVDAELFFPSQVAPGLPPFRVIVASALIRRKDHATLFDAVRMMQSDGLDVRLEVAGIGPECSRLESLAPHGTRFHGQLVRSALGRLMRRCHVAALASVDVAQTGEGTPTFLMEAIACGLPFVASDTGGVPRLASRSGAGIVVPQKSPAEFAAALRLFMEDSRLYETSRFAALAYRSSLDWDSVAERLSCLTETIVGASAPSR